MVNWLAAAGLAACVCGSMAVPPAAARQRPAQGERAAAHERAAAGGRAAPGACRLPAAGVRRRPWAERVRAEPLPPGAAAGHEPSSAPPVIPWLAGEENPTGAPALAAVPASGHAPSGELWLQQSSQGLHLTVRLHPARAAATPAEPALVPPVRQPPPAGPLGVERVEVRLRFGLDASSEAVRAANAEARGRGDAVVAWRLPAGEAAPADPQPPTLAPALELSDGAWCEPARALAGSTTPRADGHELTVVVPWSALGVQPGAVASLGVGLVVEQRPVGEAVARAARRGVSFHPGLRPASLVPHELAEPPAPFAGLTVWRRALATPSDPVVVRLRSRGGPLTLTLAEGSQRRALGELPATCDEALELAGPWLTLCPNAMLEVADASGRPLARTPVAPKPTYAEVDAARQRLQALRDASAQHPRLVRHAAALTAVFDQLVALAPLGSDREQEAAWHHVGRLARTIAAVPPAPAGQADPWNEDILAGRRASLEGVVSQADGALAPSFLFSPTAPAAAKPWPLTVFLHGRVQPELASFVAAFVEPSDDGLADRYVLLPWARGNLGAQELGESDVLAAIDAVLAREPIDRDAVSLLGFSLGGTGAFSLAVHAPARFAAVAIASGGSWLVPLGQGLGRNARDLPVLLWHGQLDATVPIGEQARLFGELKAGGARVEARVAPRVGHRFTAATRAELVTFLRRWRRSAPSQFAFVADGPLHRERSGVWLGPAESPSGRPSLTAKRTGTRWHLWPSETRGLELDVDALPGPPATDVELFWDGRADAKPANAPERYTRPLPAAWRGGAPRP